MSKCIGKKYNALTVLSIDRAEDYTQSNGKKQKIIYFNCLCDCGTETVIRQSALSSQKSCGCAKTSANKARSIDISGKVYTRLTAIKKAANGQWECSCECGNTTLVDVEKLQIGNTRSCGCLQKDHASRSMNGMLMEYRKSLGRDPNTPLSTNYKIDRAYFLPFAKETYKRDDYSCVWCSKSGCRLNAHHIETWAQAPGKRFDLDNLVTLCEECHLTVHKSNYLSKPDECMSILLQGYTKVVDDYATAARLEISAG